MVYCILSGVVEQYPMKVFAYRDEKMLGKEGKMESNKLNIFMFFSKL